MERTKSKIFILSLISSLLLLPSKSEACGFYEDESDYRAMMFRVVLSDIGSLRPFIYTPRSTYNWSWDVPLNSDPEQTDRYRNCTEWLVQCDKNVSIDDIYTIQYKTDGDIFVKAYKNNQLAENFQGNTFVNFLLDKKNKDLLNYMVYAKEMEITEVVNDRRFETWDSHYSYNYYYYDSNSGGLKEGDIMTEKLRLLTVAEKRLRNSASNFLQQRYAFQLCRLEFQLGKCPSNTYDTYFGKVDPRNLMSIWAALFNAMCMEPGSIERERLLINVFENSDEKKLRCVQLIDDSIDTAELSPKELSMYNVMLAVKNPARAFSQIKAAYSSDKQNKYVPFLVMREINKLEDWIITPLFYGKYSISNDDPFACAYYDSWYEQYRKEHPGDDLNNENAVDEKLQSENLRTDMQYLSQLKLLVAEMLSAASGETRDFYAITLAHLSLLQQNVPDARKYLDMVSADANPSIQLQKKLETAWLAIKADDIHSDGFKSVFMQNIADLDRLSAPGYDSQQMLYTLTLSLANEYLKKGDRVYGNLLRLKSDMYKGQNDEWYYDLRQGDTYQSLEYFDKNATTNDIDRLLSLMTKKNKPPFEAYLFDQPLSSADAYKDLKGTIAFRQNDLRVAHAAFASIPEDYWAKSRIDFTGYLNENPFEPKGLRGSKWRNFDYKFNKAEFVKTLIDLQNTAIGSRKERAESYIQLGNAYFNTSYWGNAWMMMRYSWSSNDDYYSRTDCLPEWMRNYMTAAIAVDYYEKALSAANDDEQRAYASVMLHYIHRLCYQFQEKDHDRILALRYRDKFMTYNETHAFKTYECPGISKYLAVEKEDE